MAIGLVINEAPTDNDLGRLNSLNKIQNKYGTKQRTAEPHQTNQPLTLSSCCLLVFQFWFLVACTRLYQPLLVGRSVGRSVCRKLIARSTRLMAIGLVSIVLQFSPLFCISFKLFLVSFPSLRPGEVSLKDRQKLSTSNYFFPMFHDDIFNVTKTRILPTHF